MMQKHLGLLFAFGLSLLLLWGWWVVYTSPQNQFKQAYFAIQKSPVHLSKFYTQRYLQTIKLAQLKTGRESSFSDDSLFLQSLSLPIQFSGRSPVAKNLTESTAVVRFQMMDTVNFTVTYFCLYTDSGFVLDSIAGYDLLLAKTK